MATHLLEKEVPPLPADQAALRSLEPQPYDPWDRFFRRGPRTPRSECECTPAQLEAELFNPSLR